MVEYAGGARLQFVAAFQPWKNLDHNDKKDHNQ